MSQPTVYLAGPISGLTFKGCTSWREYAVDQLAQAGIKGLDPMRGKHYLKEIGDEVLGPDGDKYKLKGVLSTNRGIITRDRFDATRCDLLLVNLLQAPRVSIGTVMEIAWADLCRTPIVCAMEDDGSNLHEHGMILEAIGFRVNSLEKALQVTKSILV